MLTFNYLSYSLLFKIETHLSISFTNSLMSFLPSSISPSLSSALTIVILFILSCNSSADSVFFSQGFIFVGKTLVLNGQSTFFIQQFPQFQLDFGNYDAQVSHGKQGLELWHKNTHLYYTLPHFAKKNSTTGLTCWKKPYLYRFKINQK